MTETTTAVQNHLNGPDGHIAPSMTDNQVFGAPYEPRSHMGPGEDLYVAGDDQHVDMDDRR